MKRKRTCPSPVKKTKKAKVIQTKRLIRTQEPEIHYFDTGTTSDISTTAVSLDLNAMAAGDTIITREANKIQMTALELRCIFNNKVATQNNRLRILVVYDKNANAATATLATVLNAATISDLPAVTQKSRFKILLDKTLELNQTSATPLQKLDFHEFLRIKNSCQMSQFADGTATQPVSGGLTLYTIGDVAAGANAAASTINARLYFFP